MISKSAPGYVLIKYLSSPNGNISNSIYQNALIVKKNLIKSNTIVDSMKFFFIFSYNKTIKRKLETK